MAPWSSGQDVALSRRNQGFDSPWSYQLVDIVKLPFVGRRFYVCWSGWRSKAEKKHSCRNGKSSVVRDRTRLYRRRGSVRAGLPGTREKLNPLQARLNVPRRRTRLFLYPLQRKRVKGACLKEGSAGRLKNVQRGNKNNNGPVKSNPLTLDKNMTIMIVRITAYRGKGVKAPVDAEDVYKRQIPARERRRYSTR